jgi:hypothetical protein
MLRVLVGAVAHQEFSATRQSGDHSIRAQDGMTMKASLRVAVFLLAVPGTVLLYAPTAIATAGFIGPDPSVALRALAVLAWSVGLAVSA